MAASGGRARPVRMCMVCRRRAPQEELTRLAVSEGMVVVDRRRRLPGRGAYLCDRPECRQAVARMRGLELVFKTPLRPGALMGLAAGGSGAPEGRGPHSD